MLTFIVLGIVPGTHTQLTFGNILAFVAGVTALWLVVHVLRKVIASHSDRTNLNLISI